MFYESNNRVELAKSTHRYMRERDICKLELSSGATTYCHSEDQTLTMTTVTVKPEPAPRKINDTSSYVRQTSQYFVQPQIKSLARQKPIIHKKIPDNFSKSLMNYHHYTPINLIDKTQQRLNGQIPALRDENYEGGSSTDDTEDSTDKNSKPKPGKLDLRQFDNITNAIGKLNVQSKKTPELVNLTQPKYQSEKEVASEFGYFKSRSKKVSKSKVKESSSSKGKLSTKHS